MSGDGARHGDTPRRNKRDGKNGGSRSGNQRRKSSGGAGIRAISAPYNFVPHAGFVYQPEWGRQAGHDLPFRDGLSGVIEYDITAHTPLLVGGKQSKPTGGKPGEVTPFQAPDGRWAIPGSSIKGMLRAVLEIAAFGRMSRVDDGKLSARDLTRGAKFYGSRMRKANAGWLLPNQAGMRVIRPCKFAQIEHEELALHCNAGDQEFWLAAPECAAQLKYEHWRVPLKQHIRVEATKASIVAAGGVAGTLVFTGQPQERKRKQKKIKRREFVFYDETRKALNISDETWRSFMDVHRVSKEWAYWRLMDAIPVFYLTDTAGAVASIGLARMYRLPYKLSVHDALANTASAHLATPGEEHGYDLPDLLFGSLGDPQNYALRGRVSCETAYNTNNATSVPQPVTILNSPKPSYYPNYVRQDTAGRGHLRGADCKTLMDDDAQLRGFKRYPARPIARVQELTADQRDKTKVQVALHPLDTGATFHGRIVFHNLRPIELEALLWVVSWGGDRNLRHALGMGKPFGLGQVTLALDFRRSQVNANDPASTGVELTAVLADCMDRFRACMDAVCEGHGAGQWQETPQMTNLLAMADPGNAVPFTAATGGRLEHMRLDGDDNEFVAAKNAGLVLADYAVATGHLEALPPLRPARAQSEARSDRRPAAARAKAPTPAVQPIDPNTLPATAFKHARAKRNTGNKSLYIEVKGNPIPVSREHEEALLRHLPAALRSSINSFEPTKVAVALSPDRIAVLALKPRQDNGCPNGNRGDSDAGDAA